VAEDLKNFIAEIDAPIGNLTYPFPHPRGQLTILQYASNEKNYEHELERIYRESDSRLDRIFPLHYRLLGQLLVLAEAAEKSLETESKTTHQS
jgi:hypothetical protein